MRKIFFKFLKISILWPFTFYSDPALAYCGHYYCGPAARLAGRDGCCLPSHWTFFGGHPISANGISFPNNNIPAKMETWLLFTHAFA
jgi:hypothetical protein